MDRYVKVLKKLNNVNIARGMKLSLDSMQQASKYLDFPQNKLKFVHVAGTNGKGSVTLKISKIFEHAGYKTGLYTSPHLFTFLERIQINSKFIEKEALIDNLEFLFQLAEKHKIELTFFEFLTLLSFQYYYQNKVDVVSLEVGLGGRLDATNVIQNPLASIITSISFDHMSSLGYTLQEIATEKAGIIKKGCPTIVGPNTEPYQVYQTICQNLQSPLHIIKQNEDVIFSYDLENNLITKESIQFMKIHNKEFMNQVSEKHIELGLNYHQRCRLEYLLFQNKYHIYFDVGHNEDGIEKTLTRLTHQFPEKRITVVVGFSKQKEIHKCLINIMKYSMKIHFIQANHFRAMDINQIELHKNQILLFTKDNSQFQQIIKNGSIQHTLEYAIQQYQENEIIIILGSFYLMREARQFFQINEQMDPIDLQERVWGTQNN